MDAPYRLDVVSERPLLILERWSAEVPHEVCNAYEEDEAISLDEIEPRGSDFGEDEAATFYLPLELPHDPHARLERHGTVDTNSVDAEAAQNLGTSYG